MCDPPCRRRCHVAAYRISGFDGSILRSIAPLVDLCTPLPQDCEREEFFSPVPTQMTLVSEGATATSPIDCIPSESEIGCQVIPAFDVFHTPPPADPI